MPVDFATLKTLSVPGAVVLLLGVIVRWWRKHKLCVCLMPGKFEVTWRPDS
jgi:hypothetical protein